MWSDGYNKHSFFHMFHTCHLKAFSYEVGDLLAMLILYSKMI